MPYMNASRITAALLCCAALSRGSLPAVALPSGLASLAQAGTEASSSDTLPDGTPVHLKLTQTISSTSATPGQQAALAVTQDVLVRGVTVIPKGTAVMATVIDAEHKKGIGRGGKLDLGVNSIRLLDREKAALRVTAGGGEPGAGFLIFPGAPSFSFSHARDITLTEGLECTVFTDGALKLDLDAFAALSAATKGYVPETQP